MLVLSTGCPNCGHLFRYPEEHATKVAKCPKCGNRLRLPPDEAQPKLAPSPEIDLNEKKEPFDPLTTAKDKASEVSPGQLFGVLLGVVCGLIAGHYFDKWLDISTARAEAILVILGRVLLVCMGAVVGVLLAGAGLPAQFYWRLPVLVCVWLACFFLMAFLISLPDPGEGKLTHYEYIRGPLKGTQFSEAKFSIWYLVIPTATLSALAFLTYLLWPGSVRCPICRQRHYEVNTPHCRSCLNASRSSLQTPPAEFSTSAKPSDGKQR